MLNLRLSNLEQFEQKDKKKQVKTLTVKQILEKQAKYEEECKKIEEGFDTIINRIVLLKKEYKF